MLPAMCWLHTPALRQTFLECSLLVTWWMTTISRPSPPQARVHARLSTPSTTSFLKLTHQFIHSSKGKSCLRLLPSLQRTFVLPLSILLPPFWSIFWAEWCGPCKKLAPEIEKVAEEMGDSVVVGKVDMDAERTLGAMFQILSIPTVIIFNKGEKVFELNGVNTAETYMAKLESLT